MKYRASGPSCKRSRTSCAAHGGGILACARACPGADEGGAGRCFRPGPQGRSHSQGRWPGATPAPRSGKETTAPTARARCSAPSCGGPGRPVRPLGGSRLAAPRARRRCGGPAVASSSAGSTDGGRSGLGHISSGTMGECAAPLARVGLRPAHFAHNPRNPIASTNAPPPLTTTVRGPRR